MRKLLLGKLIGKVFGKPFLVAGDLLVESAGCDTIQPSKVGIEHHALSAHDLNRGFDFADCYCHLGRAFLFCHGYRIIAGFIREKRLRGSTGLVSESVLLEN